MTYSWRDRFSWAGDFSSIWVRCIDLTCWRLELAWLCFHPIYGKSLKRELVCVCVFLSQLTNTYLPQAQNVSKTYTFSFMCRYGSHNLCLAVHAKPKISSLVVLNGLQLWWSDLRQVTSGDTQMSHLWVDLCTVCAASWLAELLWFGCFSWWLALWWKEMASPHLGPMTSSGVMSRDVPWWEWTHNNRPFLSMKNDLCWHTVKHTAAEWYVFSNNVCHLRRQCGVTVKQQWMMKGDFSGCNFSYELCWSQWLFRIDLKYGFCWSEDHRKEGGGIKQFSSHL